MMFWRRGVRGGASETPHFREDAMTVPIVWRYEGPNVNGQGWFIAFLDDRNCISVQSDFGDYQYRFGSPAPKDFREFVVGCDNSYLIGKFAGANREYYPDETLENVKKTICHYRRHHNLSKDEAREEWDRLKDCNDLYDKHDFEEWFKESKIDEPYLLCTSGPPKQLLAFMEEVWPRLKNLIEMDISKNPFETYEWSATDLECEMNRLKEQVADLTKQLYRANRKLADHAVETRNKK